MKKQKIITLTEIFVIFLFVGPTFIVGLSTVQTQDTRFSTTQSYDMVYSTFLGGNHIDEGGVIKLDSQGNPVFTGMTQSADFPVTLGPNVTAGSEYVYVAKFNKDNLSEPIFITLIGGIGETRGTFWDIDNEDNIYVAGSTTVSSNFATPGAFDTTHNGGNDGYVCKLASNGTRIFTTYFGGSQQDYAYDIALDSDKNIWVTGTTSSPTFPTTPDAADSTYDLSSSWGSILLSEAFLVKISSDGSNLLYGSFIGAPSGPDGGWRVEVDSSDDIVIIGGTRASDFPVTNNAYDTSYAGNVEGFVMKFAKDGTVIFASYLGGSLDELPREIIFDSEDNLIIAGATASEDFPTSDNGYQQVFQGEEDIFITKIAANGSQLLFSTFLGSPNVDWVFWLELDEYTQRIYFTGVTFGTGWQVTDNSSYHGGRTDIILGVLEHDGSELLYSTLIGGIEVTQLDVGISDFPEGLTLISPTEIYMTFVTISSNFPVTPDAYDSEFDDTPITDNSNGQDAGLMKLIIPELPPLPESTSTTTTTEVPSTSDTTPSESTTTDSTTSIGLIVTLVSIVIISGISRKKKY